MLPREARLPGSAVRRVFAEGTRWHGEGVVLVWRPDGGRRGPRWAVVAARQLRTKPLRHRAKRRVRHALREHWPRSAGWDGVWIARPKALVLPYRQLRDEVGKLVEMVEAILGDEEER